MHVEYQSSLVADGHRSTGMSGRTVVLLGSDVVQAVQGSRIRERDLCGRSGFLALFTSIVSGGSDAGRASHNAEQLLTRHEVTHAAISNPCWQSNSTRSTMHTY